jgi:hypothetical protein
MVVLNTTDYMEKILTLLDNPTYKKLDKDPLVHRMEDYSPYHGVFTSEDVTK